MKNLRKFGVIMGVVFLVISSSFFFRQKHNGAAYNLIVSCVFFITGLVLPVLLKPVYLVWMRFAYILSWINTRIILVVMFYLIFTPIGLVMKLFRIDLLERKKREGTYWKKKEKVDFNPLNYERRF